MTWLLVGAIVPAFLVSWVATWVIRKYAPSLGLLDRPGHRKVHTIPTPLGGGLGIWLGVVVPFGLGQLALALVSAEILPQTIVPEFARAHLDGLWKKSDSLWLVLGGGTALVVLGLLDDRYGLSWRLRLGVQAMIAGAMVFAFVWKGDEFSLFLYLKPAACLIALLWIVGLINSFNMLDNMDALSGGVAAIAASTLAGTLLLFPDPEKLITDPKYHQPQWFVAGLMLVVVGATAGFLLHNRPPAKIFMGDAGSYLLGFLLAMGTILATYSGGGVPRHGVLAPLFILAVPLYDTFTVVLIRLRAGKSPFEGDKNHFSHRLVELGMTKGQAVATIYLTTATCGLAAFLLHQVDLVGAVVLTAMVACVLLLIGVLEVTARRRVRSSDR